MSQTRDIKELMSRIDARDLARELLGDGKRTGRAVMYRVRSERTPSFAVYADGYKDFGSGGDTGDTFGLLVRLGAAANRAEAIQQVADRIDGAGGVLTASVPRRVDPTVASDPPPAAWQRSMSAAIDKHHTYLMSAAPDAQRARAWLQARGITDELIARFKLGYSPRWHKTDYVLPEADADGGKRRVSIPPGIVIPWFADGALWSVHVRCREAKLAAALGLQSDRDSSGDETAKYKYVLGSHIRGALFNGDVLQQDRPVLFVEGEFDAMIAAAQLDGVNVVTLGGASTHLAARWRSRITGAAFVCLDNDPAGRDGAASLLKCLPPTAQRVELPAEKDITDYVLSGGDLCTWWTAATAQRAGQGSADQSAPRTPPIQSHVEPLIGDHVISQRYLTALPNTDAPALAIISDVGTGKTTLAIQAMRTADTAIYVAHREKLADNFTRAADAAGVIVEHYKSLSRADRRRPSKVAFCINSYAALAGDAEGLPTAGLLILDEIAQQLEHVYGDAGTFDGQEAIFAAESLKYAIKHAGRVLALDAHLDAVSLDYLRAVRGDQAVETVMNTYTADRGALIMHEKRTGALAAGEKLIAENAGVVVYAFASVERAQTAAADLAQRLGDADTVLLLTAENADGDRQAAFIRDPNGEIGKYRAVLYSPVLGTGFDITAPVRAVIGIMGGAHLSAFDARQMIGRCRNTRETHVYLPKRSGSLEENADAIYQLELDKAQGTRRKLFIDGVIGKEDSAAWQQQLDYLRWHSRVIARRNWSMNHLRDHFVELANGYAVTTADADDPALYERQKAIKEALDAQRKEMALTVEPIDREAFRRLKEAGRVDQAAAAGHLRWKVETVIGATITPELRDQLWTSSQRSAVRHYTDLLDNVALLKLADAKEDADGVPIPRRSHRTKRRNVVIAVLNQLVGTGGMTVELDRAEFERRLQPVIAKYREDLKYLGWREDRIPTETPAIIRGILRAYFGGSGLILHSQQRTVAGEKVRLYQLDQAALDVLISLATRRLQMLERRRLEDTETSNLNFAKQPLYRGDGKFKIDRPRPVETVPARVDAPIWSPDPDTFAAVFG